ncbi:S8 family serine peptidase [Paenibacillus sp. SEL3]|uniref:S8 family serine peptidase n=1 Tax=Paenibacillus sp. FSL L8-0641 TaxID=2921605 RepID=UPI0030F85902
MFNNKQVVIIDTGIDMTNRSLSKHVIDGVRFQYSGDEIIEDNDFQDDHGHGTSVADTIVQIFNEAQFYIIKIANEEGKTSTRLLHVALKKCLNLNIKYICISISVTSEGYYQQLSQITQQLVDQNKLIFVSVKNGSQSSYPASLPTVIGVNGQMFCSIDSFLFSKNKEIQAVFDEAPIFVYTLAERFAFFRGTSKANAFCVGWSMRILSSNSHKDKITFADYNHVLEQYALLHKVEIPIVKDMSENKIDSNLVKKFGGSIEKAIYEATNHKIDISSLYEGPFISRLSGITFYNFVDFWSNLEKELKYNLIDYHSINILNVCSLSRLLKYLEEVVIYSSTKIED